MVGTELGVGRLIPGPTAWTWRLLGSGGYKSVQEPALVVELRALGLRTPNRSPSTANRASQTPVHTAGVHCMLPRHRRADRPDGSRAWVRYPSQCVSVTQF